jgi:thiamine kinase-like enzyme
MDVVEPILVFGVDAFDTGGEAQQVATLVGGHKSSKYRVVWEEDEILEEIQEEEKAVARERKKLKILVKQAKKLPKTGILYRQAEERIERFEQKMDDRLAKIAELMSMINAGMDAIEEDDEEVLLLS